MPAYPPEAAPPTKIPWYLIFGPVLGILLISGMMGIRTGDYVYPVVLATASMLYPFLMLRRQHEQEKRALEERERIREAYTKHTQTVERELNDRRAQQIEYLQFNFPSPAQLQRWPEEGNRRLWERRPEDDDFLELRLGTGDVPASYKIKLPIVDLPELAPELLLKAREMAAGYRALPDQPITAKLRDLGSIAVTGPRTEREAFGRSLLCSLAAVHAPEEVELYAIYGADKAQDWAWLKWLPHTRALDSGASPRLAYEPSTVRQLLSALLDALHVRELKPSGASDPKGEPPALVVFIADIELVRGEAALNFLLEKGEALRAHVILLGLNPYEVPHECGARIETIDPEGATLTFGKEATPTRFKPDFTSIADAEKLARGLAPMRLADAQAPEDLPDEIRLLDLVGVGEVEAVDFESRWREASAKPPSLQTPVGMRYGLRPLIIDLKQSGHGPHGLVAGTTGSGKSELLLGLLMGLALDHHPHQVNFVLVDYKGGTSMSVLAELPHAVGFVTDLDGKQTRRALVALRSEMARREEILTRYQVADIDKYHALGHREPFPYLFIVIDEFAELRDRFKNDLGDILKEFVSVAQKGRALGVSLVLAMQKPEGVVNDSIRANMRYRICLRVERAEDSRNVLGRPDAYLLPARPPGRGYFQVGNNEQFDLFQVARVAGFHMHTKSPAQRGRRLTIAEVGPDGRRIPLLAAVPETEVEEEAQGEVKTEAQVLVEMAKAAAIKMGLQKLPSPWPEPLPAGLTLGEIYAGYRLPKWDGENWPGAAQGVEGPSRAPLALLDEPERQRQIPYQIDLGEDGNVLVVGAPGSGRTTFLLSLVTSLALSCPPDLCHFHIIDFAGHQLRAAFSGFPHVAGVYTPAEPERIRRLAWTLDTELEERKEQFAAVGASTWMGYRRAAPGKPMPAIMTIINNLSGFMDVFPDEMAGWIRLLREGGAYGMYFALTSDRMPLAKVSDLIKNRIALRLADPTWYPVILGLRPDLTAYDPFPGRGFSGTKPPTLLQVALPVEGPPDHQLAGLQDLGSRLTRSWRGPRPAPVRMLGEEVSLAEVLPAEALALQPPNSGLAVPIGLDHLHLKPVVLDLARRGPLFLVTGPPESGRTTCLASIALSLAACNDPQHLRLAVVSTTRGQRYPLDALEKLPHILALVKNERDFKALLEKLETELQPDPPEGADRPKRPETVLLIDDYHQLMTRLPPDLSGKLEAQARRGADTGLTTIVAIPSAVLVSSGDSLIRQLKLARNGLLLRTTDLADAQIVGTRIPAANRGKPFPAGRGFLYGPSEETLLQIASPEAPLAGGGAPRTLAEWVERLREPTRRVG